MSVVLSIACGHDALYPFKTTGAAESPVITGQCEAGYYLSVVEKGGEPTGTRRFGLEWAYRPAGKSRVIAGASRVAELETLRDIARTVWRSCPTERHGQGHAETHASNSRACVRGSRRAAKSRTRKNVRSWPPGLARAQKSRAGLGTGLRQLQAQLHACLAGG